MRPRFWMETTSCCRSKRKPASMWHLLYCHFMYSSPCPLSFVAHDRSIDWTIDRQEAYCKTNASLSPSLLQMVTFKRLPFNLPRSFSPVNQRNLAQIFDHIRIDIYPIFIHFKAVKYLLSQMVDVHAKDRFTRCDFVWHSFVLLTKVDCRLYVFLVNIAFFHRCVLPSVH